MTKFHLFIRMQGKSLATVPQTFLTYIWWLACDELPSARSGPELVEGSRVEATPTNF